MCLTDAVFQGNIKIGDVLDKLNGVHITPSLKGRLSATLRCRKGEPINISVVKAYNHETKEFFMPVRSLLKQLNIDCASVVKQYEELAEEILPKGVWCVEVGIVGFIYIFFYFSSGYDVRYLGYVDVGSNGNVKQVEKAVTRMCITQGVEASIASMDGMAVTKVNKIVTFEFGEIGIKVKDVQTNEVSQTSSVGVTHKFRNFRFCWSTPTCKSPRVETRPGFPKISAIAPGNPLFF